MLNYRFPFLPIPWVMSLQQTAYLERRLVPHHYALQTAIEVLGFDCRIDKSYQPFKSRGYLPCVLNGTASGFEIYFEPVTDLLEIFPHLTEIVGNRNTAVTFRWGGYMTECACALIVSAALAMSFDAVVHYQESDILCSTEQLIEEAGAALHEL